MKKIICKKEYDTETAVKIAQFTYGHIGDSAGFEETLYMTPDGKYFLYANGGADSPHPKESISRMSESKADAWRKEKNV